MKRLLAALLLSFSTAAFPHALTDIWWVPEESGWGLNTVHENNTVIVALYAHDQSHSPRWYTALLVRYGNTVDGDPEFAGDLFETSGSPVGTPWNPLDVNRRLVGRASFRSRPEGRAELEYRIDGVVAVKQVRRFSAHDDRLEGPHFATLLRRFATCDNGFQGVTVEHGILHVDRSSGPLGGAPRSAIDMLLTDGEREVCSFAGAFTRYGNSGGLRGQYACGDGSSGAVEFKNIEFNSFGFTARFTAQHPHCQEFGGILSGMRTSAR
jgi:hypothetical protein